MPEIIIENDGGDGYDDYSRHHPRRHHHHHRRRRGYRYCCRLPRMHSTHRFHVANVLAVTALVFAFVLYLLPAISLPILKPVYLLRIDFATQPGQPATDVATDLRFGVWGFCASSALDLPTILTNDGECTPTRLGYTIPPDVAALAGFPAQVTTAIQETLTFVLVLHPVAAGLAFGTLLFALFVRCSKGMTICALVLGVITSIVGSVVLAIDIALVIVAGDEIHKELGSMLDVAFGNGVWMIVAAVALSWLGVILLSAIACRCCGIRRKHGWYGDGYYG